MNARLNASTTARGGARRLLDFWAVFSLAATFCDAFSHSKVATTRIKPRATTRLHASSIAPRPVTTGNLGLVEPGARDDYPVESYFDSVNRNNRIDRYGAVSQQSIERVGPFRSISRKISALCGLDPTEISSLGVAFALAYCAISNINDSISISVAWYISCSRTGLSPLAPGQWKSLLKAYGTIYAFIQVLRPLRAAAAVPLSKFSSQFLDQTQERLDCSRRVAVVCHYALGRVAWVTLASVGIALASWSSGVPLWEGAF